MRIRLICLSKGFVILVGAATSTSMNVGVDSGITGALAGQAVEESASNNGTSSVMLTTWTLLSGGVERRYSVYIPKRRPHRQPSPVVVDIHGTGSAPEEELQVSGMARAAEERGFVVILPIALVSHPNGGVGWNVPRDAQAADDVQYVSDVLDDASRRLDLDPRRIFVAGFSGGARLASEVASTLSYRIAALGAVGGLRAPSGTGRPVPVIAFHGTEDPVNPFDGGGPGYWRYGLREALEGWIARNHCTSFSDTLRIAAGIRRVRVDGSCSEGELQLHILDAVGHVWPGSHFVFPADRFGPMTDAIDATSLMLDFFARHPLPVASKSHRAPDTRVGSAASRSPCSEPLR